MVQSDKNNSSVNSGTGSTEEKRLPRSPLMNRVVLIVILLLFSWLPLGLVDNLVSERHQLYGKVLSEIAGSWGNEQKLIGPFLMVPVTHRYTTVKTVTDNNGKPNQIYEVNMVNSFAMILPNNLTINLNMQPQSRTRGIYAAQVYSAKSTLQGEFALPDIHKLSDSISDIHWNKSFVAVALSDTRAITKISKLNFNAVDFDFSPHIPADKLEEIGGGFHARVSGVDGNLRQAKFSMDIEFNGSNGFRFAPVGKLTETRIQSSWPHPSFRGQLLPGEREISEAGFKATWKVPNLARNYPQEWMMHESNYDLKSMLAGVDIFEPVSLYSQITRSVKYGLLFIALTFMTFLIFEITVKSSLHLVQYGLIGVAMTFFYLTLLSLSEHISFINAYVIASIITICLISLYTWAALRSASQAAIITVQLVALYLLLYSLLRLEDYALLMGTGLLLVALMVLMFVTRNLQSKNA